MNSVASRSREGFTLIEILVALVLIGLLVGTLVPSIVSQIGRSEYNRVQEDLEAVNTAAKAFKVDVQRWPGDLEDVVVEPTIAANDSALTGGSYPVGLSTRWSGPYLEVANIPATGLATGLGSTILNRLSQTTWNGSPFLTVKVLGIAQTDAHTLSTRVDGDTAVGAAVESAGKVRWKAGTAGVDTLLYLASPVQ